MVKRPWIESSRARMLKSRTEIVATYEIESYREDIGILSEDLLQKDVNPYFEEEE